MAKSSARFRALARQDTGELTSVLGWCASFCGSLPECPCKTVKKTGQRPAAMAAAIAPLRSRRWFAEGDLFLNRHASQFYQHHPLGLWQTSVIALVFLKKI